MARTPSQQDRSRPRLFQGTQEGQKRGSGPALARQGITITANYVGNIKATHNKHRRAVKKVVAKGGVGIPEVKAALAFLKVVGSVAAAKQALAVAQEIREIV